MQNKHGGHAFFINLRYIFSNFHAKQAYYPMYSYFIFTHISETQLLVQASDCMIYVAVYMNDYFRAGFSADSLFELIEAKSDIRNRSGHLKKVSKN